MKLLSLDIATKTGWATNIHGTVGLIRADDAHGIQ